MKLPGVKEKTSNEDWDEDLESSIKDQRESTTSEKWVVNRAYLGEDQCEGEQCYCL